MKKTLSILLAVVLVIALAVPTFAANVAYSFNLSNTGQTFKYYGTSNTKAYLNDAATIQCTTTAPGFGYKMQLAKKSLLSYTQATAAYWYSGTNYTLHPSYLSGMAAVNTAYYVGGRIDDSNAGPYPANGVFNSDYTNP